MVTATAHQLVLLSTENFQKPAFFDGGGRSSFGIVADGKMTEVARMKLSEAGWQALADDAINVRAK